MSNLTAAYDASISAWQTGDIDLLSRALTDPGTLSPLDVQDFSQKLGFKDRFLSAAVNVVSDPTVILAFLLSRNFPTSQYIRGEVPQRFVGAANEFSGVSSAIRTVESFFRGTNIPKLTALKQKREAEVMQVGNRIFDDLLSRSNWKSEMPVVSLLLEGQHPAGSTPELQALAGRVRTHMDELWGFLERTHKVTGGFFDSEHVSPASAAAWNASERPRYLRDYLPHIPLYGEDSALRVSGKEAIAALSRGHARQLYELARVTPDSAWKVTAGDRLTSNFGDYQRFMERAGASVFNPRLFQRMRFGINLQSAEGQGLFVTDLNQVLQRYVHSTARTYALNAPLTEFERGLTRTVGVALPTAEPIAVQVMNEGLASAGPVIMRRVAGTNVQEIDARLLNGPTLGALRTMMTNLLGKRGPDEIIFGNTINSIRRNVWDHARRGFLPASEEARLADVTSILERQRKDRLWLNRITSYFYGSTLGLNVGSAVRNLLQPAITTAPAIGLGPTLEGYSILRQRLPRYARAFIDERRALANSPNVHRVEQITLGLERAFEKTFPELAKLGIKADPRAIAQIESEMLQGRQVFPHDSYFKLLLSPFTQAEQANQVVSFYGTKQALRKALVRGELEMPTHPSGVRFSPAELDEYLDFESSQMVSATQFRPGPGGESVLQSMVPTPLKMFTRFGMMTGNFFANSTVKGAISDQQLAQSDIITRMMGGRNWGTMARAYMFGRVVTEGAKQALGVDLSESVGVYGPFANLVESGRVVSPLNISPVPGVVWGALSYAANGDIRELSPLELPGIGQVPIPKTLVPAGVAISRMARAARTFRPDMGGFVDDEERLVFQGDGTDLVLSALGLPLEKQRRTREVVDRSAANQLRVKQFRRAYATAARNADFEQIDQLSAEYNQVFPDMPPLSVSDQDQTRYNEAARLTTAQRAVRWLGRGAPYVEAGLYESDPELIGP